MSKDKITGGLADSKSVAEIAKKHGVSIEHIDNQLKKGIKVELEHTDDRAKAREIAMDHLWESADYYDHLEDMEAKFEKDEAQKYDRVEVSPDGKRELDYGDESLEKPPVSEAQRRFMGAVASGNVKDVPASVGKDFIAADSGGKLPETKKNTDLRSRWSNIKKSLDHNKAIMDISEQEGNDEESPDQRGAEVQSEDTNDNEQQIDSNDDTEQTPLESQQDDTDTASQSSAGETDNEQKIIEALRDEGYSPAEIAYIIHGQVIPEASLDDEKISAVKQKAATDADLAANKRDINNKISEIDIEHRRNLSEAERAHKKQVYELERKKLEVEISSIDPELERAHKKRMLDLEYEVKKKELDTSEKDDINAHNKALRKLELEHARAEMQIDLEFKKAEAKLKLEEKKALAEKNLEHKVTIADIKHTQAVKDAKGVVKDKKENK